MAPDTLADLEEQLRRLPPEQLTLVAEFVASLAHQRDGTAREQLLRAAETSLRKDWDSPEEDAAWANL